MPIPITLLLLAAGAFAALGDFNIVLLFFISFSALICGDNVGYWIGRIWGSRVLNWIERSKRWNRLIPPSRMVQSRQYFRLRGGLAIFLSRFLFSALGGIINLLSGSELYPYRNFLFFDSSGEALGAIIPLLLGYIFGASWEAVGDVLGYSSFLILSLLIVIILVSRLIKNVRNLKLAREINSNQSEIAENNQLGVPLAANVETPSNPSGNLPLL
ncbi:MAG TPA: VTT domain-containing protein [Ktedonobacteraceae bacterium]|nr:VTT domain-containing protein [Ktedonobacteraceae bacterium]